MMGTKTDSLSTMKHVIDGNQYNYIKDILWELMKNEDFTEFIITTSKDANYFKKVHGLIVDCFCKALGQPKLSTDKSLVLHHEADVIEHLIIILYFGKCIVPVAMLPKFMDLSNYLNISELFVYDERDSNYFLYLMQHKNKLLNYLCFAKKNCINCDAIIVSKDFINIPAHKSILGVYSLKFVLYYKNRIENKNPVLFYVPSNSVQIEKILEYCYFGQIIFSKSDLQELSGVATILGINRFLENCKFSKPMLSKRRLSLNIGNDFILVKPPENSDPVILENIKENSTNCFVYLWVESRCVIIPTQCFHSHTFKNDFMKLKNNDTYDVIIFLNNEKVNSVKRFIHWLYTKDYTTDIEQFIDLFGLQWPYTETNTNMKKIWRDNVPLFADNVEDLQTICDKVFKTKCSKDERIIQLFTCQICGIELLTKSVFIIHCREHEENRVLCDQCGQFVCESRFADHVKKHHTGIQTFQCEICLQRFAGMCVLKSHRRHSSCFFEKCKTCNKSVKKSKIALHKARHVKNYYCTGCNKTFSSKQWLHIHQTIHESRAVECIYCHLRFLCKSKLRSHVEEVHFTNFYCSFCTEYFTTQLSLSKHSFKAHPGTYAKCDFCGKKFTRFHSLRIHLRKHSDVKQHRCKFCTKSFYRFDMMYYHVQMVHEGKRFVCPTCNRQYSSKYYFVEHGWACHKQYFNPNLHMTNKETLQKLDPRQLSNQVIEITESSLPPETEMGTPNNEEDTIYKCSLCTSEFSVFNDLLSHLERTHV